MNDRASHQPPRPSHQPPRLCVGVPVYNGESFLAETLDSILAQTFEDFEVVISDNASTDQTREIAEACMARDPRVRYVRHDHNVGASANFTSVSKLCRSEYFKWVAADDPIGPRFFELGVAALDADPDAGLAHTWAVMIDGDGVATYRWADLVALPTWSRKLGGRGRQVISALLQDGSTANAMVFGVIRSSVLDTIDPIGNYFGADMPFVAELAMAAPVIEIESTQSFYRRHTGSSSSYTRSPSAKSQQEFYDPSVRGRFRLEWNRRRRYWELVKVAGRARGGLATRLSLVAWVGRSIIARFIWRIRFELDARRGTFPETPAWHGPTVRWPEVTDDDH